MASPLNSVEKLGLVLLNRIYWTTVLVFLWAICWWTHAGLALFLLVLGGLAASVYWLIGSRTPLKFALATAMTLLVYLFSVSPILMLVIVPSLEQRMDEVNPQEKVSNLELWKPYSAPFAMACKTRIGETVLIPYHKAWVSEYYK